MPIYSESELNKSLRSGDFASFYLLSGSEDYLRDGYERKITRACFPNDDPFNLHKFDMSKEKPEDAADAIETLPVFAPRRMVVLRRLSPDALTQGQFDLLYDLLSDLPDTTTVVCNMVDNGKRSKRVQKLTKLAETTGVLMQLSPKSRNELHRMLQRKAQKSGVNMSTAACDALIEACGTSLARLQPEADKLIAAADGGDITPDLVESLAVKSIEASAFDITRRLLDGKTEEAVRILNALLSQKEPPVRLFYAISSAFLDLYRAKCGQEAGFSYETLAGQLSYKGREFALRNAYRNSKKYDITLLREILDLLANADIRMKTGGQQATVLQQLLIEISAVTRGEPIC